MKENTDTHNATEIKIDQKNDDMNLVLKGNVEIPDKKDEESSQRSNKPLNRNDNINFQPINSEEIAVNENKKKDEINKGEFVENNVFMRNVIDNALFSQLSEINVKLLDFSENVSNRIYGIGEKIIPKIDFIEFTLLNQNVSISELKKYGFGLYVFFLYLRCLLITFGVMFIFALHYMYRIFFKFYREYEDEYSVFFDFNILSLVSGVQLIKFRKYYTEVYGKEAFLENYEYFDVIYKEYLFTGTLVFIVAFLINFGFLLYLLKVYKIYRIENPEIKNYTLIISGKDLAQESDQIDINDENININNKKAAMKNNLLKKLNLNEDNVDINFTFKLFKYYEKMEEMISLRHDKYRVEYKINKKKCCCYGCCCFCGCCFCCCCNLDKLKVKEKQIKSQLEDLEKELEKIKENEIYNPLYIITFKNKEDYDRVYSEYPHSYIKNSLKSCCKKRNSFYANKAPSPEDIMWNNLEFDKEYKYFKNKFKNLGISLIYVAVSFVIQLIGEFFDSIFDNIKYLFIVNIIVSYLLDLLNSLFTSKINYLLANNSNSWSRSDIKFYSILFRSIFKLINQGIFPLVTYYCFENPNKDDYSKLVSKMFVIIEMDGFGYPMVDWLYNVVLTKGKDMYESTKTIMSQENVENELSENMYNQYGLSKLELEQTFQKKEMDLEQNYSDTLSTYWITMFYASIYPVGIIQSFLNLLFRYIIEKNFLLNVYKRPDYINPQFGFLCFNCFNIGFFLFLCGDIIFFRNADNKKYYDVAYIIIMILILLLPFYLLAKLIMCITNYCCLKQKESERLDDINEKIKSDYRLFNPCYQKEKIEEIFTGFKNKDILTESQYKELIDKLERLNYYDLYKLQESLKAPKIMKFEERKLTSTFIYDNPSYIVTNQDKEKLYYFLMQLNFISYLEEGNVLKPKKKRFEYIYGLENTIKSPSLLCLSMQENLSNSDSGFFTTFNKKDELIMAYVDNQRNVKIFDVFHKRVLNDVKDLKHKDIIVCVDYFSCVDDNDNVVSRYLVTISLDNTMIISNLTINEKNSNKIIENIGDTFTQKKADEKNKNHTFCLSTARHDKRIWIITSYYYDTYFKIFNNDGVLLHKVINNENIISLEGLYFTEENTYICVRTDSNINLFINQYFIKQMPDIPQASHINFKIIRPFDWFAEKIYIIIVAINYDLTFYNVKMIDIFPIFPLFTRIFNFFVQVTFGSSLNDDVHVPMNTDMQIQISKNNPDVLKNFYINYEIVNENQRIEAINFFNSDNVDKFNIGNILFWDGQYIIIGTPYNYLDIIDYKNQTKIGRINNIESAKSLDSGKATTDESIISYNISKRIEDPEYGSCFIMRDNKGKIQYIRPTKVKDRLNYRLIKSDEYFNDMDDNIKLNHIAFSTKFYFFYCLISYLIPLICAIAGHNAKRDADETSKLKSVSEIVTAFPFYVVYGIIAFWFKGCVYDITAETHTKRTCTKMTLFACLACKVVGNSLFNYGLCKVNKTGIIFIIMLYALYIVHGITNFIIYSCQIKFLLKIYWLGFLFYQISRLCILIFFILTIIFNMNHYEAYIYIAILCVVSAYMYLANYFNALMKDIAYTSYFQAVFNYPCEWMNLFCCWCTQPKDLIKDIDEKCCVCDSFFLQLFEWLIMIILVMVMLMIYFYLYILCACFSGKNEDKKSND